MIIVYSTYESSRSGSERRSVTIRCLAPGHSTFAPRGYRPNTTVILTFEGVDYRRRDGAPLDLRQVKFRGQPPISYSNETQSVSYWLTVDGGQEYTISEADFEWPADQEVDYNSSQARGFFNGDLSWQNDTTTTNFHWLTWTDFHNLYAWVVGPTNVLYLGCSQQPQTNITLTGYASTGDAADGAPFTAGTYTWSVIAGGNLIQMTSSTNVATITPTAPSATYRDVQITMTFTTPRGLSYIVTNSLTVLTPGGIQVASQAPGDLPAGSGFTNACVYQVVNQLPDHAPLAVPGLLVHEDFPTPAPADYQRATKRSGDLLLLPLSSAC